ncbi:MAG: hypothetical protein CL678_07970 [Bdellovibrionaceae bacterium]|nr:hypothetical protein [Pseudobdellovibrionaceae bacterium]|tara:strand:+ start:355 stop:1398 length:1044 start_codon:yes stop_codon:yes gene_type:complete
MTKRILIICLTVAALSANNAMASRARTLVFGTGDGGVGILDAQGTSGSFFVDDAYNMNYNPAYVNDYTNWVTLERDINSSTAGNVSMGGIVTNFGSFNLGVFMNRQNDLPAYGTAANMRPLEVIFGGDHGVKWGVGLGYAAAKNGDNSDTDLDLKAGVSVANFEPFLHFKVLGKEKVPAVDLTHQKIAAGLRYHWGEWSPVVAWRKDSIKDGISNNRYGLAINRNTTVGEGVKLSYNIGLFKHVSKNTGSTASTNRTVVPLNVAAEGDFFSWWTMRAGFGYNVYDQNHQVTTANAMNANFGSTWKFGPVDLDWVIGGSTSADANNNLEDDFGVNDGFFTAASLTYTW